MSKLLTGSVCLTDLIEQAKKKHSAFSKAKNDKIYGNIAIWINDEPDKYGNTVSIQLNSEKDKRDAEGKIYIGNAKPLPNQKAAQIEETDTNNLPETDGLPF
jgi:hypothetical protein